MDMKMIRRARIRRKFKQIVRMVMRNAYWLNDSSGMTLGDNVQANVTILTQKRKTVGGLSFEDKCIMRKPTEWRTFEEKNQLFNTIGNMKCFRQWPENVKFQLVGLTYFIYFPAGRIVVKQDTHAQGLYFIISGEMEILQTSYDEVTSKWVTQSTGKLGSGSMFGEVSLLLKIPLVYSLKTLTDCELIRVDKDDFDETLSSTLQEQWNQIKKGLASFSYFNGLSENARTECCTLSQLKLITPGEIIYGYNFKKYGSAYFILEGRCKLIEKMYIKEKKIGGRSVFSRYNPNFQRVKKVVQQTQTNDSGFSARRSKANFLLARKEAIKEEIYKICPTAMGLLNNFGLSAEQETEYVEIDTNTSGKIPIDVECHFLQVCTLHKKACFFENEMFDNRYLVSETPMKLLIIPCYWLFQNNRANIWTRLETFLGNLVPSSDEVFKKFKDDRKWMSYKKMVTKDALGEKINYITTVWSDLPYSLRISEVYKDIN